MSFEDDCREVDGHQVVVGSRCGARLVNITTYQTEDERERWQLAQGGFAWFFAQVAICALLQRERERDGWINWLESRERLVDGLNAWRLG